MNEDNSIIERIQQMKMILIFMIVSIITSFVILWFSIGNELIFNIFKFSINILFFIFGGEIIAFFIFFFKFWRCPKCAKFLGRDINIKICEKCGIKLQ